MNKRPDASQFWSAFVGVALISTGILVVPGTQTMVVTTFVVLGAASLTTAAILPKLQELEVGPKGMKAKLASMDPVTQPLLVAEGKQMTRLATMTCGDPWLGRELVEEAITKTKQQGNRIPREERGGHTLRNLLTLLETAPEYQWLRGRPERPRRRRETAHERAIIDALRQLEFRSRVASCSAGTWDCRLRRSPISSDDRSHR